jgi:peptide/nickel transport system permease protein
MTANALPHVVDKRPFDPQTDERLTPELERYYLSSQFRLMWLKLRRHRLAVISGVILALFYASILVSEFLSPYAPNTRNTEFIYAPPQDVRLFHDGRFVGPFVYGLDYRLDMETLKRVYSENNNKIHKLRFFCFGDRYYWWGMIEGSFHLVCPAEDGTFFFFGTDRLGRDVLSRMLHGARISLTIGVVGIVVSFVLGIVLGGLAGYYGGWIDSAVNRAIEVIRSFPKLPLFMALSAALPVWLSPIWVYFGITLIVGLVDWTGLARAVRAKLLALREEDFCTAAVLMGAKPRRIIGRHLLPSFMSHLIAVATLHIPEMILAETALSFLGLGLRPPVTSWGVLLTEAQNPSVVLLYPWLLVPMIPVVITVLAFNFLGDGLRDAADPYR